MLFSSADIGDRKSPDLGILASVLLCAWLRPGFFTSHANPVKPLKYLHGVLATVLSLTFLAPIGAHAQGQVSITALGGVGLTTLSGDITADLDPDIEAVRKNRLTGFNGRAAVNVPLGNEKVGMQLGVAYARKGISINQRLKLELDEDDFFFGEFPEDINVDIKLDYLEFPILFRYRLNTGTFSPYFMPGLKLSILTDCTASTDFLGEEISISCNGSEFDTSTLDIGFHAGAGMDIALIPSVMFTLDVAYNYGLSSVFKDSEDFFLGDGQGKNRGFSILAGVTVPIGR